MDPDPITQWRAQRLRRRARALLPLVALCGTLALLWRYVPNEDVRGIPVDLGPLSSHDHRVFGTPPKPQEPRAEETAATALGHVTPDLLTPLDVLRERGTWCGEEAPTLRSSQTLSEAAQRQAMWLATSGVRRHTTPRSPSGETPQQRANHSGYTGSVGEVIAWGQRNGQAVMDGWEASPEHCPVVMDPAWVDVGWGMDDHVWVMLLGLEPSER